jgi:S1-C subfamily serine protease
MFWYNIDNLIKWTISYFLFAQSKLLENCKEYKANVSKASQKSDLLFLISMLAITVTLIYFANSNEAAAVSVPKLGLNTTNITNNNIADSEMSQELFEKVKNSVVRIDTLAQYINPRVTVNDEPLLEEPAGFIGSGFVYDQSGKIITNYHVVRGAEAILVKFLNGNSYKGTIVGVEPLVDLAVIQLDPSALYKEKITPLPLADPSEIRVGTPVVAIGSPVGLTGSMTEGIISQVGRIQKALFFADSWVGDLIQTDAPITHGNSGGPLLNFQGKVVGVNDRGVPAADMESQSTEPNIGLAISAGTVKRVVDFLIANGTYTNPYLGVIISDIPAFFPEKVGLSEAKGAYILSVLPNGPASTAKIKPENVVIKADEKLIQDKADLINYIQTKSPGDKLVLTIIDNNGITKTYDVILDSMPVEFDG